MFKETVFYWQSKKKTTQNMVDKRELRPENRDFYRNYLNVILLIKFDNEDFSLHNRTKSKFPNFDIKVIIFFS